jgi:hypothetical protein
MSSRTSNLNGRLSKPSSRRILGRRRIVGLTVAVWAVAGALLLTLEPRPIAVAGALAIGWSHLVGRCGLSHFGALTPRGKLPGQRARWLSNVLVYVVAGALASSAVGIALAAVGSLLVPTELRGAAVALVLLLATVAAATELRLIHWRLPDPNLQTRREWGMLRPPIPAVLWGFSLGLTFATVFTFSGTWLVLALPLALGEPVFGATVLLAHWVGRAAPILAGPVLLDHAGHTPDLLEDIESSHSVFRASNIVGIGLMALSLLILLRDAAA